MLEAPDPQSSQRRLLRVGTFKKPWLQSTFETLSANVAVPQFRRKVNVRYQLCGTIVPHSWYRRTETALAETYSTWTWDDHVTVIDGSQSSTSSNSVNWHKDVIKISWSVGPWLLNASRATVNSMRCGTGIQCNVSHSHSVAVVCSFRRTPVIIRAAACSTVCNLRRTALQ